MFPRLRKLIKVTNKLHKKWQNCVQKFEKHKNLNNIWPNKQSSDYLAANIYGFSILELVAIADSTHISLKTAMSLQVFIKYFS